ncbi:hypothetical protein INT45_002538 [Circinella minor]|uniref:CID domain-containing protein n=1 Tax=Circinella minor TaxID=1195481 RepID=A0A8H7RZ49_9FUNG|nr:hypothetical protein INT45_002538 [Circinella minor]
MSLQQNNIPMTGMNQAPGQGFSQQQQQVNDIETVRRNYREALYELTFNSKPIITNLTIMAQENQHAAAVIVREIEQQIRHNAAGQKLPVLYLIDSICKNVGGVYLECFGRDIASTFLDAYTVTDVNVRRSFERLLHTWKNGMPNGAPVFSRQIIESIERPLNYIRSRNQGVSPQQQPQQPHHQPHHQQSQQQQQHINHHHHLSQQHQQPQTRFPSTPQKQPQRPVMSPRNNHQQIHVNPNFVPKRDPRDPRDPRGRNSYQQERISKTMPSVSKPLPTTTTATTTTTAQQSPLLSGGGITTSTNNILSTLQSMLPSSSQVVSTDKNVSQLLSQIQSMLPSLPPQQSSAIQQHLDQIFGNNNNDNININNNFSTQLPQTHATNNLGNILNGLPFSMPPVSTPIMATSTPPVQSQGQVPVVGNIGRLSHSPPIYQTPPPLVSATPPPAAISPTPPPQQQQQQQQQSGGVSINTAELLKGLTSMGILGGNTPPPTTTTTPSDSNSVANGSSTTSNIATETATTVRTENNNDTTTSNKTDEKDNVGESTEKTISLNDFGTFKLESKDLQIVRSGAIELLYSGLPLQCKQCGFRYPKTSEGQSKMDAHLDSHFRQNRRMKERVKRGLSRSWFVTEEEWVSGSGGELTSHQAPAFLLNDNTTTDVNMGSPAAAGSGGDMDTINPETHMVVMPNDEDRKPCPICGERFIDFWNDDEEEWMYKNAVMVDNTIYHATCHADAVKSGTLVGSSEQEDTEMKESIQGVKRKAEEDGNVSNDWKKGEFY